MQPTNWRDLGCESLADKPFGILSQGERQQVLIARARMARPMLLVLDEPCAGMDPGVRERFLAWLDERIAGSAGPTVVLVTHHIEEIVPGIQNTLILAAGRTALGWPHPRSGYPRDDRNGLQHETGPNRADGGRLWPLWGK